MRNVKSLSLPDADKSALKASLAAAGSPYADFEGFLLSIYPIFANLPRELLSQLFSFRNDPASEGVLHLRNFPLDDGIPHTPSNGRRNPDKKTYISEGSLLGVARILGEPFGYYDEKDGEIVQNLAPVKSEASSTSSESSGIDLGFHTDLDFDKEHPEHPYNVTNADYVLLICLRQDPKAEACTMYADARDICQRLTPEQLHLLRQPLFQFGAAYTFTGKCGEQRLWSQPAAVIRGSGTYPEISIELACGIRALTAEAKSALAVLAGTCCDSEIMQSVFLKPGDLLLINNRKGAHARTAFTASFDGNDRWLQRMYARRCLWNLRKDSNRSLRVF